MEILEFELPYKLSRKTPIDICSLIHQTKENIIQWTKELKPEFKKNDGIKLTYFSIGTKTIKLTYEIIRDKWKS